MAKTTKLLVSLALLAGTVAQAQEVYLTHSNETIYYQVGQKTSYFNNGPVMKSWIKGQDRYLNKYSIASIEVHCPTGQYRITQRVVYVNGGYRSEAESWTNPNAVWVEPVYDSVGSAFTKMCS
jgi:hypothetical protein